LRELPRAIPVERLGRSLELLEPLGVGALDPAEVELG